jgi:capsular exopolysaccharide synthesis family protein
MTTIPANMTPVPAAPRTATTAPVATAGQVSTIDPMKLLNKHKWLLAGTCAVGAILGVGAHVLLSYTFPRWRPTVLFNVLPPQENLATQGAVNTTEVEMNRFMQTQVRVMTSDTVLNRVIEDPQLRLNAPDWYKQHEEIDRSTGQPQLNPITAIKDLQDYVSAKVLPQTNLIELSMTDTRKFDATAIVSLVRQKYMAVLKEQSLVLSDDRTRSLRSALSSIDAEVAKLGVQRENIIQTKSVNAIDDRMDATRMALAKTNEDLSKVTQSLQGLRKQLEQLKGERAEGRYGDDIRADVEKDPEVLEIESTITRMQNEEQGLLNMGIGRDHRDFKRLEAQLDGARQNLERVRNERMENLSRGNLDTLTKAIAQYEAQELNLTTARQGLSDRLTDLTRTQAQLADLDTQIKGLLDAKAKTNADLQNLLGLQTFAGANRVVLLQSERVPTSMDFPKLKFMIPAGMVLCLGLVGGIVLLREVVDQRVKGPSDITIIPRTKLLGWVPDANEDPAGPGAAETAFRDRPRGIVAESFRQIRGTVAKRISQADHKTILVLSGMPGSGGTSTVANLAFACAAADRRVLIIDANFRRPTVHRVLGLQEGPGLADVLGRGAELADAVQATSTPGLDLLSAGSKEQRVFERLATEAMGELLTKVRMMYDIVLVDVAPAIVAGDGVSLAHRCDASILVVKAMAEKRGMVARIKNDLTDARSEFLGVIVNAVKSASGGYMRGNIKAAHEYQKA